MLAEFRTHPQTPRRLVPMYPLTYPAHFTLTLPTRSPRSLTPHPPHPLTYPAHLPNLSPSPPAHLPPTYPLTYPSLPPHTRARPTHRPTTSWMARLST